MAADGTAPANPFFYLKDMDEVQKVFNRFDANRDGMISSDELAGVLRALGSDPSDQEVDQMMAEIDSDKDGRVSLQEFAAFCNGDSGSQFSAEDGERDLREAFEHYDQDGNGQISSTELHQILSRLGERCTVDDCARMIKSFDSDGDGYVSFDEFRKMMGNNNSN